MPGAAEDAHVPHQEAKVRAEAARSAYVDLVRRVGRTDDRFVNGVAGNLVQHLDQHFGYMVDGMLAHESARELNARWIREDRSRSFEDARRSAFLSRDRFVRTAREVPIERWNGRLVSLFAGNSVGHYGEHLEWMEG